MTLHRPHLSETATEMNYKFYGKEKLAEENVRKVIW